MSITKDTKPIVPALIVFGKPGSGRPHAAWFHARDTEVAKWVARRLGLSVLKVRSKAARTVVDALPEWQINPAGQPVIPVVKHEIFEALLDIKATSADKPDDGNASNPALADQNGKKPTAVPLDPKLREFARQLWGAVSVNSVVLAREDGLKDGWWEAVILAEHAGVYTLYYRDYPEQGLVRRQRQQIALLPPTE
jgi:hypothetical protein